MNYPYPLVIVEWQDAQQMQNVGWHDYTTVNHTRCIVSSVGWLLSQDKDQIIIVPNRIDGTTGVMGTYIIPISAIRHIYRVNDTTLFEFGMNEEDGL